MLRSPRLLLRNVFAVAALALAACAQLPPSPQDIQAKRFEPVSGMSVIYIARDNPDLNEAPATLVLDDAASITTYPGTYYRWEAAPGRHRIAGFAGDSGSIVLDTQPGRIYYVQQWLARFLPFPSSHFQLVSEPQGRAVVIRGEHIR